jgi:hypothetical protein
MIVNYDHKTFIVQATDVFRREVVAPKATNQQRVPLSQRTLKNVDDQFFDVILAIQTSDAFDERHVVNVGVAVDANVAVAAVVVVVLLSTF